MAIDQEKVLAVHEATRIIDQHKSVQFLRRGKERIKSLQDLTNKYLFTNGLAEYLSVVGGGTLAAGATIATSELNYYIAGILKLPTAPFDMTYHLGWQLATLGGATSGYFIYNWWKNTKAS